MMLAYKYVALPAGVSQYASAHCRMHQRSVVCISALWYASAHCIVHACRQMRGFCSRRAVSSGEWARGGLAGRSAAPRRPSQSLSGTAAGRQSCWRPTWEMHACCSPERARPCSSPQITSLTGMPLAHPAKSSLPSEALKVCISQENDPITLENLVTARLGGHTHAELARSH